MAAETMRGRGAALRERILREKEKKKRNQQQTETETEAEAEAVEQMLGTLGDAQIRKTSSFFDINFF